MSAHTPGPWHALQKLPASYSDHGFRRVACLDDRTGGPAIYAEAKNMFQEGRGFVWGDVSADARLIAAAPDLLEALKALDADWSSFWPLGPDVPASGDRIAAIAPKTAEIWRTVRAAIAKATGAQQ